MTKHNTSVSVVICAYTEARWQQLQAAVQSLHNQTYRPNEIIVVIDHNDAMRQRVRNEIAGITVIANTELKGASGAKNSGVLAAKSEWIAFLDDDAAAEPEWLAELMQVCLAKPDCLGTGGWVVPAWEGEKLAWLPEEFYWVIGASYCGMPTNIAPIRNLFAGCMCLHHSVFANVGGFRAEIGPLGKRPINCEETELCIRATQQLPGKHFYFNPAARIHHHTPKARMTLAYFKKRCYAEGLAKALVTQFVGANDGLSSERRHVLKTLPLGVVNGLRDALQGDINGGARALVIILGLGITATGYGMGLLMRKNDRVYAARQQAQTA